VEPTSVSSPLAQSSGACSVVNDNTSWPTITATRKPIRAMLRFDGPLRYFVSRNRPPLTDA
jgi:hypothetical protein